MALIILITLSVSTCHNSTPFLYPGTLYSYYSYYVVSCSKMPQYFIMHTIHVIMNSLHILIICTKWFHDEQMGVPAAQIAANARASG